MTGTDPTHDDGVIATWRAATAPAKALLLGLFVNRLGAFLQVFLVLFLVERGFSSVQAGFALGLYSVGAVLGTLVGGTVTDRFGGRFAIVASMAGSAPLLLAVLYLDHYPVLLLAVVAVGAASNAFRPASAAMLSQLTAAHRTVMIFAMQRLTYNLGSTAAPLLGAGLVAVSYDLLFWAEAAVALGYAAVAAVALPRRAAAAGGPADAATPAAGPDPAGDTGGAGGTGAGGGYLAVLADRRFVLFLLAGFVNALVYMQYLGTLPLAMQAAGLAVFWYGAMVSLNGLIVITCELLVTKVVQRWPMRIVVLVGFLLLGGGMACYALPWGLAAFVVGTLIWSLAEIVAGPTMFAYPAVASPEHLRGRYLGAASGLFNVGSSVAPAVGVAVWGLAGGGVWLACGAACLLGAALAWRAMTPSGAAAGRPAAPAPGATAPDAGATDAGVTAPETGATASEAGATAPAATVADVATAAEPSRQDDR